MICPRRLSTFLIFTLFSLVSLAQTGTIRGFAYDKETEEPLIFTNVYLVGTTYGSATNVDGFFTIAKVPPGKYTISVSALGYDSIAEPVEVVAGRIVTKKLYVPKKSVELKTFEFSAEKQEAQTNVQMSMEKVTAKDITKIPSVGGEADIAQYLQVLPGVIFTGDQGGQLYIRGGSPIQNKVLLDGMIVYNPFHSIGLFSVFDTDIIRNADVFTGGFNAEYGGRISSVMDITTRDGNKKRHSGKVGATTFGAKALLEGPLRRSQGKGRGSSSYIFSGKHSYLDRTSQALYSYANDDGLPFTFTDLYGKISFNGSNGSKFNVFGFRFDDQVNYQLISDMNWTSYGGGSNFVLVPGQSPVLIEGNFSYSQYKVSLTEDSAFVGQDVSGRRFSAINGFNGGLDFTYFLKDDEIKYGIELLGFSTEFEFFNAFNRKIEQQENTTEFAGYLRYKFKRGNLIVDPSFRVHYYASLNTLSPEPRLGLKFNITEDFRFKAAGGLYSQNLISANSDRDVVNLFSGFLSGPENLQSTFTTENGTEREITHKLQKAWHGIVGMEYDLTNKINLNVEGYYKLFSQLTNINRNKLFADSPDNFDEDDRLKKDFIVESGNAYGLDVVTKYDAKKLYVWLVYSIAYVDRWDGFTNYNPIFDRRHNVNFLAAWKFGKGLRWEFNTRWNYGSGFPFTQTQGFYERYNFTDGINTDYVNGQGELGIIYDDLNQGRLPAYHRLDVNLKRTFAFTDDSVLEMNFGITNAYSRENIFYFDRIRFERVNQLPIMPSFGANWSF